MSVATANTSGGEPGEFQQHLADTAALLVEQSLAPSSKATYHRAFKFYQQFGADTFQDPMAHLPISEEKMLLFIAYCFTNKCAVSTTSTYLSALGHFHKIQNLPDVTQLYLVKKAMQGYHRMRPSADNRLPVTMHVMTGLVKSLQFTCTSFFERVLIKTMYLLAFHAFLRVGEFTSSNKNMPILQRHHVLELNLAQGYMDLVLENYKHSKGKKYTLRIKCINHEQDLCPVHAIHAYIELTNNQSGPLFAFMNQDPVSRAYFTKHLNWSLAWAGFDNKFYKGHSFRIGAATHAASRGYNEEEIRLMGRWNSSAFRKYIRVEMLTR